MLETNQGQKKLSGLKIFAGDEMSCLSSRNYVNRYVDFIKSHGAMPTKSVSEADIVLVDTCAYSQTAEQNSLEYMKKNQAMSKPGATFIVSGCLASINPQKMKEEYKGHFFSPKTEKQLASILGLDEEEMDFFTAYEPRGRFLTGSYPVKGLVAARLKARKMLHWVNDRIPLESIPFLDAQLACSQGLNEKTYSITISQGCLGNCSFCVIPLSKGKTSSLPLGVIVDDIQKKFQEGVRHFYFASEDTGAYGQDIQTSIVALLEKVMAISNKIRIYLNFFDPRWLVKYKTEMMGVLGKGQIKVLHIPLQSGSNSTLARMRRVYQMDKVWPIIEEIKVKYPRLYLTTEFIVGFPGESEQEFEDTRKVVKSGYFNRINVFGFSSRKGAATEKMEGHLPQNIVDQKTKTLKADIPLLARF